MKLSLWRHLCSFLVVLALCVMAYYQQMGVGEAPSWFIGIGSAVVTQYLIEFWQSFNERRKAEGDGTP